MASLKPTDRQLLLDVKEHRIVHQAAGYDWNLRTGRDVTDAMRRLETAQLVSRVGPALRRRWRPTRLGHTVLSNAEVA